MFVVATAVPASVLQSIDVQASCRRKSRLACVESDGQRWGKGRASRRSERVKCRENRRRGVGGKWVHARWKGGASTASRPTGACGAGRTGGAEWTPGTHPACRGGRIRWDAGAAKSTRRVDRAPAHAVPWPRIRFGWTTAPRRVCTRGTLTFARLRGRGKSICIQSKVNHLQLLRLAGLHLPLGANEVFGAPHLVGNLDRNGSYYVQNTICTL